MAFRSYGNRSKGPGGYHVLVADSHAPSGIAIRWCVFYGAAIAGGTMDGTEEDARDLVIDMLAALWEVHRESEFDPAKAIAKNIRGRPVPT